jgi:thiamine biosynthesis lipoprotein
MFWKEEKRMEKNEIAAQMTHPAMGTVMAHRVFGEDAQLCLAAVTDEIARLEGLLSRFLPGSDVSRVNASAGFEPVKVGFGTFQVLLQSLEFSRAFPDCFAVTIGPLVDAWRNCRESLEPPDEAAIRQALSAVSDCDLKLDPWALTAELQQFGQSLDLGGIGKGYAADRVLEVYRQYGIVSAYSNLGGNVVTLGTKPDGSPWRVGIQHPRQEGRLIGSVAVSGQSVVTSGDYQRFFTDRQGIRRHHILDPKTGFPAQSGLISVTIVTEKSLAADALSTVVFVAGLERGLDIVKRYPQAEAVLVDTELRVFITAGLRDRFQAGEGIVRSIVE